MAISPRLLILLLLLSLLPLSSLSASCVPSDRDLLALAFRSVAGFHLPPPSPYAAGGGCPRIRSLSLPSQHLTGSVGWGYLRNITALAAVDLSGNRLEGSIPGSFWSAPALVYVNLAGNRLGGQLRLDRRRWPGSPLKALNLSGNRFTTAVGFAGVKALGTLDLSHNSLNSVPQGLESLHGLTYLDLSHNSMRGSFPKDFPPLAGLEFLNVSYNNLSGVVESEVVERFGRSAFINAGSLSFSTRARPSAGPPSPSPAASSRKKNDTETQTQSQKPKSRKKAVKVGIIVIAAAFAAALVLLGCVSYVVMIRKKRRKKGWKEEEEKEEEAVSAAAQALPQEAGWVAEARLAAPVVVFQKPLLELTFLDLAAATSKFGKESQLSEGSRSGPAYRAVLPGDMHVVIRVLESAREVDEREAAAAFRDLARLRHPNLLPLLGYCIAGREKLLLYEYMERGDLHRWLHELPTESPDVEDWSGDALENQAAATTAAGDWPTRHRIALGIARGLAFLHQGWVGSTRGVAHGRLTPSNVLLGDDLEPRIADFGIAFSGSGGDEEVDEEDCSRATAEGDVYSFGAVVMELVTGREGWSAAAVGRARELVRAGRAAEAVDPRLTSAAAPPEWEREMLECLRVGYLCTAPSPEKRPSMQQVVGLLKDIRSSAVSASSSSSS